MIIFTRDFHPTNKKGLTTTAKPLFCMAHSEGFEPSTARFVAEYIVYTNHTLREIFFHPLGAL